MVGCLVAIVFFITCWGICSVIFGSDKAIIYTPFLMGIVFIFFMIKSLMYSKKLKLEEDENKEKIKNYLKNIDNFISNTHYIIPNLKAFIALDEKNRKIAIGGFENNEINCKVVQTKEILDIELTENGKGLLSTSENKNTLGMAAIGGLLFGGAGAIVGAISGSNSKSKVTEISLKIAIDDIKKSLCWY